MPTATVAVKFLNSPKEGKKMWSIKAADDSFYLCPPEKAPGLQTGATYEIEYTESEFRGQSYKTITKAKMISAPTGSVVPGKTTNGSGVGKYGHTDMETAERIYVCGGLNAMLNNPSFNLAEVSQSGLVALTQMLRGSWSETFGGKPSLKTEMGGEEIPYA